MDVLLFGIVNFLFFVLGWFIGTRTNTEIEEGLSTLAKKTYKRTHKRLKKSQSAVYNEETQAEFEERTEDIPEMAKDPLKFLRNYNDKDKDE